MLFIFDWDGTLSDSADKIVACVQAAAVDTGLEVLDDHTIKNIIGLGLNEALHTLYGNMDTHVSRDFVHAYATHFKERDKVPSAFFPRVMETLNQLRDQKFKLAVATGKSRKGLDRVLANLNLEDYFHYTRCADETKSKPHPLMLEELINEAGCSVSNAVMVGDTEWDMLMADRIGMKKIAVSHGAHEVDRLKKLKPDMLIDQFDEILNWRFD